MNAETNELIKKYGLPSLELSSEHIHLLPHEAYEKLFQGAPKGGGRYIPPYQAILFSDLGPDARLEFAQALYHEMIHFKFWNALQVTEPERKLQTYRTGLAIVSRDGKTLFLRNLNEAVAEDLTEHFFEKTLRQHPLFSSEIAEKRRVPRGYSKEKKDYHDLLQILEERTSGKYTVEELRELFVGAAATGTLLPVARLIEGTLGKGSLRLLGGQPEGLAHKPGMPTPPD